MRRIGHKRERRAEDPDRHRPQLIFDKRSRLIATGLAVVTAAGGAAGASASQPGQPKPNQDRPDNAKYLVLTGRPPALQQMLAERGLTMRGPLFSDPFSSRSLGPKPMTILDVRAQAQPPVEDVVRVPHVNLHVGMGKNAPNEDVRALQRVLQELKFLPKSADANGRFNDRTKRAVERLQLTLRTMGKPTEMNGAFAQHTRRSLAQLFDTRKGRRQLIRAHNVVRNYTSYAPGTRYAPWSAKAKKLFRAAARLVGLPESWATSSGLHNILSHESDGYVGIPNYTYGARRNNRHEWTKILNELKHGNITAASSATGLGQLLSYNAADYYPHGLRGLGVPLYEAAGMLRYIHAAYGTPDNAWRLYGVGGEGY